VGTPEFTPPELQGKPLDRLTRTANHDAFGLAVLIFNLLFMGRHPFSGRYLSSGEMPLERAIEEFRFAYSARRNRTRMEPPPNVPLLTDIPADMRDAFETAFGKAGVVTGRPQAADWVRLIGSAEKQVIACRASLAHQYLKPARSCPWCRMEAAFPGFVAFTTTAISSRASSRGGAHNQLPGPHERRNGGFGAAFYAILALAGLVFLWWLASLPPDEPYPSRRVAATAPHTTPYTPPRDYLGFNRDGQRGGSSF
jgi:hypothetical protein